MRSPGQVRAALGRRLDSSLAAWLADPSAASFSMPLHPPTSAIALADPAAVAQWVHSWHAAPSALRDGVQWQERRWAQLGTQRLPVRWVGADAHRLARCAGERPAQTWRLLSARVEEATAALMAAGAGAGARASTGPGTGAGAGAGTTEGEPSEVRAEVAAAVAGQRSRWLDMQPHDAELTIRAATWFLENPRSGVRIRQVPLPGMHTKWLNSHRAVVSRLVAAGRADGSEDLGLAPAPVFHDLLVLDAALRGEGLAGRPRYPRACRLDLAALPAQGLRPEVVLLCENSETVQVLPDLPGVVALSGAGYSVPSLLAVPWIAAAPVLYWGDLDADGLRILDRARHHHERVTSVLMDHGTLETHRHLVVDGGVRAPAALERLTPAERRLHEELSTSGQRLEQERIELRGAVAALEDAVAALRRRPRHR